MGKKGEHGSRRETRNKELLETFRARGEMLARQREPAALNHHAKVTEVVDGY